MTRSAVSELLLDWRDGDDQALEKLTPMVYQELRRLAHRYMSDERRNHLLQSTALVHEAYLKLVGLDLDWQGRTHFFAVAARLMRRILVDYARKRATAKRGGDWENDALRELDEIAVEPAAHLLALNDALTSLATFDERKSQVVELRFFGGLTIEETATHLGISHATVERDLKVAKAWLSEQMGHEVEGLSEKGR